MNGNEEKLRALARRSNAVLKGLDAVGVMGVYHDPASLDGGSLDLVIKTNIPETLTPEDAIRLGRALSMLGSVAQEACDGGREADDDNFFAD